MKNSIWDSNLQEFLDRTASHEPTPGGGSVSAVVASEGLALVLMALEVNMRRKDAHPEAGRLLARGKVLLDLLTTSADEDIRAFEKYMAAMRMPKFTPQEEEARTRAIEALSVVAMKLPLQCAERCRDGLALAKEAIVIVHSGIASDVGAGAALLHGALTATLYNVDINLRSIPDEGDYREGMGRRDELQHRGDELAYIIHKETEAKIRRHS